MPEVIAKGIRAPREPRNGVNTSASRATINAAKETPALATFQFRASHQFHVLGLRFQHRRNSSLSTASVTTHG
jgi:hypothetical protein